MLDWLFPPSCPCDPHAKGWIERSLKWLSEEFDDNAFNGRPLVLPTPEFFPDPFDASYRSVRAMLDRVCGYMDVDPRRVRLEMFEDENKLWLTNSGGQYIPQAAGTYHFDGVRSVIRIGKSQAHEPVGLVGTLAHELAHVRLLGESRLFGEEHDNELLTDLTTVVFGLGIFLASTPRTWDSQYSTWPGTDFNKPEYMTQPMFGYALAHLAWFRGEERPPWRRHLHGNSRPDFKQALRFLFKTQESTFKAR